MEEELACVDETAPIWKYYHQEEDAIMNICMENFISCFLQGKALVIETPVSTWKIITNGQKKSMFLYHRNEMESYGQKLLKKYPTSAEAALWTTRSFN